MAYTYSADLTLGAAKSGLTLTPTLRNSDGTEAAGMTVLQNYEVIAGSGSYYFEATLPDGHRGFVRFMDGATFVAKTVVSPQEVENTDVKTSTRSSHTAADVWAAGTRTLTGFGTLVADIWASATRTLTAFAFNVTVGTNNDKTDYSLSTAGVNAVADQVWDETIADHQTAGSTGEALDGAGGGGGGGSSAADIWTYPTRTLTTAIAAVSPPPVISGATVSVPKGDTWILPFTNLGVLTGNTKLWLTIKADYSDTDSEAIVQVERTVGLVRLNGGAATAGHATVTVLDAALGNVTFTIDEAATVLVPAGRYYYDVQSLISGTIRTHTSGRLVVAAHVTAAIS